MADTTGVMLTGGDFQALPVLRAMSRRGIPVAIADHEHSICRWSRFAGQCFKSPSPFEEDAYVDFLMETAARSGVEGWVLMPNSDAVVRVISRNRDRLAGAYRVATPEWAVTRNVYIKRRTYELAKRIGIPIPETYFGDSVDEVLAQAPVFPLVVKPSVRDNFYPKTGVKAFRVNTETELRSVYARVQSVIPSNEILVQSFIDSGPQNLYSFCPYFRNGRSVAWVTARRARQHPMDFGHATTYAELTDIPELKGLAEAFLSMIGYQGIAEVEFMRDRRDGRYKLIEVNPRIWGWHGLAIAAGADLPYLQYLDTLGKPLPEMRWVKSDLKWVRMTTDIPTVLLELAKGKMTLDQYIRSMRGRKTFAVYSRDDPLPCLAEAIMLPYLWAKRGF